MNSLTEQEQEMLEGVFNAVLRSHLHIMLTSAKSRAIKEIGPQKQGQKSLGTTHAYHLISETINHEGNSINGEIGNEGGLPVPFMPRDLRSRLPEDLRNIAPASLSRVLDRIAQVARLERREGEPESRSRRRSLIEDRGGRRSYYYPKNTRDKVDKLLAKTDAQEWLNRRIIESGLLLEYFRYYVEVQYHEIRLGQEKMLRTVEPHINREEDRRRIESSPAYFQRIRELDEGQLEEEAEREALIYVERHKNNERLFLLMMKGISITARDSLESQAE